MEKTYPGIVEWLADQRPEVWHAIASQWNWDDYIEPLEWIAAQPESYTASVAVIFWVSTYGCDVWLHLGEDLDALNDSDPYVQAMFELIGRNAYNSVYKSGVISFRNADYKQIEKAIESAFNEGKIDWKLSPHLIFSEGEPFSDAMLTEKEKEEVEFALNGGFPD